MSLLETINKILHYGDHEQILFDVILGAIVGGIGVGIAKSSFKGDYSNIIELILGGGILLNYPFNPISHGIGFVLAVDGFSSIVDQAFFIGDCIPFRCLETKLNPVTEEPEYPPGCEKYIEQLENYYRQHAVDRGVVFTK